MGTKAKETGKEKNLTQITHRYTCTTEKIMDGLPWDILPNMCSEDQYE